MRKDKKPLTDIEICRNKIKALLEEYNCELWSADEYSHVLIYDKDTQETKGFKD
jgi:hypothetical protein